MIEKTRYTVGFPCASIAGHGRMATISCFTASEVRGAIKVVSGIDDDTAARIIGASRHSESAEQVALGVIALFDLQLFTGESYGLALAIADKMARYRNSVYAGSVYATGYIPLDGCGDVAAVDDFEEKLTIMEREGCQSGVFVFPSENLRRAGEAARGTLNRFEDSGLTCLPVDHVNEIFEALCGYQARPEITVPLPSASFATGSPVPTPIHRRQRIYIMLIVLVAVGMGLYVLQVDSINREPSASGGRQSAEITEEKGGERHESAGNQIESIDVDTQSY